MNTREVQTGHSRTGMSRFACLVAVVGLLTCEQTRAQWPQWGGPARNFVVDVGELADEWPEGGPEKRWHRELGDGYSSVVVDGGLLYTMYRVGNDEFTVSLDAETGDTVWEQRNPSPFTSAMAEFGPGPHSTPLIAGNRVFTIGTNAVLRAFDKRSGEVHWKHDLAGEHGGHIFEYGYACSPVAYGRVVIVPVGRHRVSRRQPGHGHAEEKREPAEKGAAQSLVAFDQSNGSVAWKGGDFPIDYSSPILATFDGIDQVLLFGNQGVTGLCPDCGELHWHHPVSSGHGGNFTTPLWIDDDLLFCSSSHTHSRMLKLTKKEGGIVPEEVWSSRKMGISHGNAVRVGDHIIGSSGRGRGPAMLIALDIRTGERAWVDRSLDTATLVHADGKLIILADDGSLALATVTPEGLTIHSKCKISEPYSWTAPTLVGSTLYVRDRKHVMALDVG